MVNSLVMIAAFAVGADGYYSEYPQEPELVVVHPVSEYESSVGTMGPEQESTFEFQDEAVLGFAEGDCCYDSNPHVNLGFHHRFYPSPCYSPGNMPQHFPYVAEPKNYYYFRPYNWFNILDQQKEVVLYGGDPRHPYANDLFEEVYRVIEAR